MQFDVWNRQLLFRRLWIWGFLRNEIKRELGKLIQKKTRDFHYYILCNVRKNLIYLIAWAKCNPSKTGRYKKKLCSLLLINAIFNCIFFISYPYRRKRRMTLLKELSQNASYNDKKLVRISILFYIDMFDLENHF